ncbi:uncharacterized protein LOC143785352 isoform X1 [Ranitomeya variabilis]|uniref:uncharacterized protein LOC143785352 isoform X1 n=2 Tax=Ranitomeya variabilis TaxID=490064 RepID=UPI004056A49C
MEQQKVMADKCSFLYEQLVILFFGHRCDECEETGGILQYMAVPVCHSVDGVLSHMKYCQAGMSCRFPGCSFARVIVSHWKICRKNRCPVILNLSEDRKKKVQVRLQAMMSLLSVETPCKILFMELVLLFHNHHCEMCKRKDSKNAVPLCHSVDAELSHMKYCTAGMSCRFPGCPAARSIISHWKKCSKEDCLVAFNLRKDRKQNDHPVKKKTRLELGFPFFNRDMTEYQRRVLFLIYHAWNCNHRQTTAGIYNCDLPECRTMRAVLQHMESCEDGSTCQFSNCRYVSFTFTHYMICLRHDCEICWPVRSEINQLCGLEQLPATIPSYSRWKHLTPAARACNADSIRASWVSSITYRAIRTKGNPVIGPPLFLRREQP